MFCLSHCCQIPVRWKPVLSQIRFRRLFLTWFLIVRRVVLSWVFSTLSISLTCFARLTMTVLPLPLILSEIRLTSRVRWRKFRRLPLMALTFIVTFLGYLLLRLIRTWTARPPTKGDRSLKKMRSCRRRGGDRWTRGSGVSQLPRVVVFQKFFLSRLMMTITLLGRVTLLTRSVVLIRRGGWTGPPRFFLQRGRCRCRRR